jgi:ATP-dependent DNA helicase RecQ
MEIDQGVAAFTEHGEDRLRPIYDSLNEQVSYDKLHLLRIYFLNSKNTQAK